MKELKDVAISFVKYYLTVFLGLIVAYGGVANFDWKHGLESSLVAALPVLINYLNPSYNRYGVSKTNPNENSN